MRLTSLPKTFLLILTLTVGWGPAWTTASVKRPDIRIVGVSILVPDMETAVEFYTETIGFEVASMDRFPDEVVLKSETLNLNLVQADKSAQEEYAGTVRTTFGFQANDLRTTRRRLEDAGVEFIEPEPVPVGIGIATTFHDPFGNVLFLLEEQVGEAEPFREPRIYNVGYHIRDVTAGRAFYCDLMGFVVRTERYFPAIPLGHRDGSFAFMLHEKQDLKPHNAHYPSEAQVLIRFETDDLSSAISMLEEAGATPLAAPDRGHRAEGSLAVRDPFGNVFEIAASETQTRE